jgi:3-methylcrotonyl-CoA carboxylase alpha subunit
VLGSLLIANRGEIACRIIRTARRLGIRTIAVHSDADARARFVREADLAVAVGSAPARASYLNAAALLEAALHTGAEGIHPGYGFLSENAEFAEAVQGAGLVWVGAPPAAIRTMGRKDAAKRLMQSAGVPVTPGYWGEDQSPTRLQEAASGIGYPVLIKAVAGGGGKGMRRVDAPGDFAAALAACRREAAAAFGDERVLIEKYVLAPRHIEVQIFGDTRGRIVHLFERDCSLQRRHQKVVEEAPAPGMDATTRAELCAVAVKAAAAVAYVGAGTIEFIADASLGLRADRIWFMEMNTRLQVEHPVTEAITGVDLVEWQLRVASGEALPRRQEELHIDGHALEARLYAENPSAGFLPSTGPLRHVRLPAGLRVDSGFETGDEMSGHYDPLMAKLIVHAPNRAAAAHRLAAACARVEVWPVRTNAAFLARVAADPEFLAGMIDTGFIERRAAVLIPPAVPDAAVVRAAARALLEPAPRDPPGSPAWTELTGFRVNAPAYRSVSVAVDGRNYVIDVDPADPAPAQAWIDGQRVLFLDGGAWTYAVPPSTRDPGATAASDGAVRSPMPGRVVAVTVRAGEAVLRGQTLLAVEAMKMEHALISPSDGVVADLAIAVGDLVTEDQLLVRIVHGA